MSNRMSPISFAEADSFKIDAVLLAADKLTPLALAGATIKWSVCEGDAPGGALVLLATNGDGITVVDEDEALIQILINPPDHPDVVAGDYYHQCQVTLASGYASTQFEGQLKITASNPFAP